MIQRNCDNEIEWINVGSLNTHVDLQLRSAEDGETPHVRLRVMLFGRRVLDWTLVSGGEHA